MVRINDDFQKLIPPLTTEEYARLEESLKIEGCRDALVVWGDILIDGHNRFKICQQYNISYEKYYVKFDDENQAKIWIVNNQLARRNLTLEQKKHLIGKGARLIETTIGGNRAVSKKLTVKKFAEIHKTTRQNVYDAIKYSENIDRLEPEVQQKILTREIKSTTKEVEKLANKPKDEQKRIINYATTKKKNLRYARSKIERKITEETLDPSSLPAEKYEIILADPPWRYDWPITESRAIERHYPTMELEDIKNLEIPATDNAVLFLWAVAPKIQDALDVIKAWDFIYRTHAIWDKEAIGTGFWFRGQHELLLLGIKGSIKTPESENRYSSIIRQKKTGHSQKPDIVYEIIEKMFPNRKYLELFARKQYNDKWTVWGNQL